MNSVEELRSYVEFLKAHQKPEKAPRKVSLKSKREEIARLEPATEDAFGLSLKEVAQPPASASIPLKLQAPFIGLLLPRIRQQLHMEVFNLRDTMTGASPMVPSNPHLESDRAQILGLHSEMLKSFQDAQDRYEAKARQMGYLEPKRPVIGDVSKILKAARPRDERPGWKVEHPGYLTRAELAEKGKKKEGGKLGE